jgi:tRNA1Val (adenine37-N6)-methyltransferase
MNTYFQFKQFIIHQDKCAQKVSETACIQGAWTTIPPKAIRVLDIGSGTGLLSLMIAQRYPAVIVDAIEIEQSTYEQLNENIQASEFRNRIKTIHQNILTFHPTEKYNFIIVNPPFFENQLSSPYEQKNQAWHSTHLSLEELAKSMNSLLHAEGAFSILLPYNRKESFDKLALSHEYSPYQTLLMRHSENHPIKFMIGLYSKNKIAESIINLNIKRGETYSDEMTLLMKPFYLKL